MMADNIGRRYNYIPKSGLFSLGTTFPNGKFYLALAEIFLIQKFTSPITEKSHVSDI